MKSKQRNTFNGMALAVIQSTGKTGSIKITAASSGLKETVLHVVSNSMVISK
jgi:hypothetical protein